MSRQPLMTTSSCAKTLPAAARLVECGQWWLRGPGPRTEVPDPAPSGPGRLERSGPGRRCGLSIGLKVAAFGLPGGDIVAVPRQRS